MKKITTRILSILSVIMLSVTAIPQMNAIAESGGAETAVVIRNEIPLKTRAYTIADGRYGQASPISDFIDPNGIYTIAYANDTKVFISHISNKLEISDTITIKKPMSKIGGVCCDKKGNFYIACGQKDKKRNRKVQSHLLFTNITLPASSWENVKIQMELKKWILGLHVILSTLVTVQWHFAETF